MLTSISERKEVLVLRIRPELQKDEMEWKQRGWSEVKRDFYMKRIYLLKMYIILMNNVVLELPDSFQVELLTKD